MFPIKIGTKTRNWNDTKQRSEAKIEAKKRTKKRRGIIVQYGHDGSQEPNPSATSRCCPQVLVVKAGTDDEAEHRQLLQEKPTRHCFT